jgi:predicted metalloprotease with PDZ domain
LDSGAGHVLFLDENGVDSSMFSYSDKKVYLGKGLNGAIIGSWGKVPQIQLGAWSWNQVPTAFPHAKHQVVGLNMNRLQGSIGGEFLRRYVVTFNYLGQYILFKPIARLWKRSFDYGMSGLNLKSQGENFRKFVVETVEANSPAEEAGMLVGDEIWTINGIQSFEYQLGDIYRILKKKEGKKVDLVIRRGQNFQLIQLKLRKLF